MSRRTSGKRRREAILRVDTGRGGMTKPDAPVLELRLCGCLVPRLRLGTHCLAGFDCPSAFRRGHGLCQRPRMRRAGGAREAARSQAEPYLLPTTQLTYRTNHVLFGTPLINHRGCHGRLLLSCVGAKNFGAVELGDRRSTRRLIHSAAKIAAHPIVDPGNWTTR